MSLSFQWGSASEDRTHRGTVLCVSTKKEFAPKRNESPDTSERFSTHPFFVSVHFSPFFQKSLLCPSLFLTFHISINLCLPAYLSAPKSQDLMTCKLPYLSCFWCFAKMLLQFYMAQNPPDKAVSPWNWIMRTCIFDVDVCGLFSSITFSMVSRVEWE